MIKLGEKRGDSKLLLIGIILISLIGFVVFVSALTDNEKQTLQQELSQLESNLTSSGYDWLVNYSVSYPSVDVYRENSNDLLATFFNVSGGVNNSFKKYQIFLTNLTENESLSTFDLKSRDASNSGRGISYDYVVDPELFILGITTYENVSDVYYDFLWETNNMKLQIRSCDDSACSGETFIGPGGTAGTYYDYYNNDSNIWLNIPQNQYFQYKAFLWRNDSARVNETFTPILQNVSIGIYNSTAPFIETPSLDFIIPAFSVINCTTRAWTMQPQVNVTFSWYRNNVLYNTTNISSTNGTLVSNSINYGVEGDLWNCSVSAYDGAYSENKSRFAWIGWTYENVSQVYYGNEFEGDNVWLQVRSCDDALCSGETFVGWDNTTSTYFKNPTSGMDNASEQSGNMSNISSNQWFQYKAFLFRNTSLYQAYTPTLYNVTINTTSSQLTNYWNCSASRLWTNASCWSLGHVPLSQEDVLINGTYNGDINITNNSMAQYISSFTVDSSYTGKIRFAPLFAVGSWGSYSGTQEWNVTNNINISGGTMYVYGDAFNSSTLSWMGFGSAGEMHNITYDGRGQVWKSVSGGITVGSGAVIDGVGLGFGVATGPGSGISNSGGSHGGYGTGNGGNFITYGNASAPTSLGSGGQYGGDLSGGSAIKLDASSGSVSVDGIMRMNGVTSTLGGAGGSIWIKAINISGAGAVKADGVSDWSTSGGGRIRFDFTSLSYTGVISANGYRPGTFSFSSSLTTENLTYPGSWTLNGSVGLAAGNYTINGNLVIPNGTMLGVHPLNDSATDNGTGVVINVNGNVTIQPTGSIDGVGEGFQVYKGLGYQSGNGKAANYGGRGFGNTLALYGSETYPISLGSGKNKHGGGAIKINATESIIINGNISMDGESYNSWYGTGSGGSILLIANNISGSGNIISNGGPTPTSIGTGGGGRIALHTNYLGFTGLINNQGGIATGSWGSGGTVYINATTITSLGNISVAGYNGSTATVDNGQRITFITGLATLSGIYNASNLGTAGTSNGTITANYTDCGSVFSGTFQPSATKNKIGTSCSGSYTMSITAPANGSNYNNGTIGIGFNATSSLYSSSCLLSLNGAANITMQANLSYTGFNYTNSSIGDGSYNAVIVCSDTLGDSASSSIRFLVDTSAPTVTISAPLNNSYFNNASVLFNVSSSETSAGTGSIIPNLDNSLVSWWRMDDTNSSGDVVDYIGCYDNETKILTENGWKYFADLGKNEKVMTLNNETGKLEWQIPTENKIYNNSLGYMYNIETSEGSLLVSEEHKVYSSNKASFPSVSNIAESMPESARGVLDSKDLFVPQVLIQNKSELSRLGQGIKESNEQNYINLSDGELIKNYLVLNSSDICFVEIPMPILNSNSSYVHNLMPLDKQSATKSSSLICAPKSSFALEINDLYDSNGTKIILSNNNDCNSVNSSEENLDFSEISSLCFVNSSFNFIGANISKESLKIISSTSPAEISVLKKILESITTSIHISPLLFRSSCMDELTLSASSLASCSVNLDFATIFLNFSNASLVFSCLNSSCFTNSDQTIQTNLDNWNFTSSSIANVTDAIYNFPLAFNSSILFNSSNFLITTPRATSATFTSGNVFLKLANTSSGICTVIFNDFAILSPCSNYFNRSNYANVYKSFGSDNLVNVNLVNVNGGAENNAGLISVNNLNDAYQNIIEDNNFSLNKITDVYSDFNSGKEVYFLDSENKLVKVKSIEKVPYSGKIYDVDVPNDIVLVKRGNSSAIWSGNSNNGSKVGGAVQVSNGKFGKGFSFDGSSGYLLATVTSNKNTTSLWYKNSTANSWTFAANNGTAWFADGIAGTPNQYPINISGDTIKIGINYTGSQFFNGTIDDVMIFNRSLTSDEILGLYNATRINHNSVLGDGAHTLNVYAQDLAANIVSNSSGFNVDTIYPTVTVFSPLNNTNYSYNILFNVSSSETTSVLFANYTVTSNPTSATYSANPVSNPSGFSLDSSASGTPSKGVEIQAVLGITSIQIQKDSNSGSTKAYLYNTSNTLLASSLFSGTTATIDYNFVSGINYYLVFDNQGSSYNDYYQSGISFPVTGTTITYVQGVACTLSNGNGGCSIDSGTAHEAVNITTNANAAYTSGTPSKGVEIQALATNITSIIVQKDSSSTSTKAWLYDASNSLLASSLFSGNTAIITYALLNATNYYLVFDNQGSSYNDYYQSGISFPITGTTITYVQGVACTSSNGNGGCSVDSGYIHEVMNITTNIAGFIGSGSIIPNLDNSLVSWWRMDDVDLIGHVNDYMGKNNGTISGGASQVTNGIRGKAFTFDGVSGTYVQAIVTSNKNTTSLWYKNSTANSWTFAANNGTAWFADGIAGTPNQYPINISGDTIKIGINYTGSQFFNGLIDDAMIFNRSLSAAEILALYNSTQIQYYANLTDATAHTYMAYAQDYAGNVNLSSTAIFLSDRTPPAITINYPLNTTTHYTATVPINVTASDATLAVVSSCWYHVDLDAGNTTMQKFNASFFNATYTIAHGLHNLTVWCNDTLNNVNYAAMTNFSVNLADLTVSNVTLPSIFYSNATLIAINISNLGPPTASNVNVSCYLNNVIFDSRLIATLSGLSSYITNCTLTTISGNDKLLNVTVDPDNTIPEANENNNKYSLYFNVTQLAGLNAYDLEDDSENKYGWFSSEQETLPKQQEYFFANYTMSNSSSIIAGAGCNITLSGGNETGTSAKTMSYNSTALLYYYNKTFSYAGNYTWQISCEKLKYETLSSSGTENTRIPLYNQSSLGLTTGKTTVNYNENINLTVNVTDIDTSSIGYNISRVWAAITRPDNVKVNVTLYSLSGSANSIYNATYTNPGILGAYSIRYYANLTNSHNTVKTVTSNFSIENTSITINAQTDVNTTQIINVNGLIRRYNGSDYVAIANNLFLMKLNNVTVSSDTYNYSSLNSGNGTGVNISASDVRLNLTSESGTTSYSDDYSTTKYLSEAESYNNQGYAPGQIFNLNQMSGNTGNITYKFSSVTQFYNASAYITTSDNFIIGGGNNTVYYSFDNSTWLALVSTTSTNTRVGGTINADKKPVFYLRIANDKSSGDNPVSDIEVNTTSYDYAPTGTYYSSPIDLANVTYTVLKWTENLSGGTIKIQLRESSDNSTWTSWSDNFTNYLDNDISSYTKRYIQFKSILETGNLSLTPKLQALQIMYFNASTNSSGGYSYNITIPTNSLGIQPLEVSVVQNSVTGIAGSNTTYLSVWAQSTSPYYVIKNYTGLSNYSVTGNFTRADINALVNGTINISISNATAAKSKTCYGSTCVASWTIPNDLGYGNYTVNITLSNETAYYRNYSVGFGDYLEEKNTSGTLYVANKSIFDYNPSSNYSFEWNASISNTGKASISSPHVWAYEMHSAIQSVSELSPCSRIFPGETCNATMFITIKDKVNPWDAGYYITWRVNWTDNDGSITGGVGYVQYVGMRVFILGNSSLALSNYSVNNSMEHNSSKSFTFQVLSVGSNAISSVNVSFLSQNITAGETIPSSWVFISPDNGWINSIVAGGSSDVTATINIPAQTTAGNYSGIINASADAGGEKLLNIIVSVPLNTSWYYSPAENFTYNRSFSLNSPGEIGNITIVNTGNANLTMNLSYSPAGTKDFIALDGLFTLNKNLGGIIGNPSSVNITRGENSTITMVHNGWDEEKVDIGIIVKIYNESAFPSTANYRDAWEIKEQYPNVTGVWFYLDGAAGNIAEQRKNVTIKIRATDDVNLNLTGTRINISWSDQNTQISASDLSEVVGGEEFVTSLGRYTVMNYTGNYTPMTAEQYTVIASILDISGKPYVSSPYTFTSYGTTTLVLAQNISVINISDVDFTHKSTFYVNYSVNNTGLVKAYSLNLSFSGNSSIIAGEKLLGNISGGMNTSSSVQINVSQLTLPGQYNLTATLKWINPNLEPSTTSKTLTINVASNKSMINFPVSPSLTVGSGASNSTSLLINNTGNDNLASMNLNCYSGALCSSFNFTANESSFSISRNSSRNINITLTAPNGLAAGSYSGFVNISEQSISKTFEIGASVPETKTWTASPLSLNATRGASASGKLADITITSTGNVNMTMNLTSTNSSIIEPNMSSINVSLGTSKIFAINYTSPVEETSYSAIITITNVISGASPTQLNVSVNLTVTALDVLILSPNSTSPAGNLTAGESMSIIASATYGGVSLTANLTWNASIDSTSCLDTSYAYNSANNYWNLTCALPILADGRYHNITITANHNVYGSLSETEENAVYYRDISPPSFSIARNNIDKNQNINLQANVTDNVNVSGVSGVLIYPNSSEMNISFVLSAGLYINNSIALDLPGEYLVNYTANDTTNNINSTLDWFEVYDKYYWSPKLVDYANNPQVNINMTLLRPNTTIVLLNNVTNSEGKAGFNVNKRYYDLKAVFLSDYIIVKNISFANITSSGMYFNLYRISSGDLDETVTLHKAFHGFASNSTNLSENAVQAVFNYTGLDYSNSNKLEVVKCASWNFTERVCSGVWSAITSSKNIDERTITGNSTGFSAYFLSENTCGDGACQSAYGETTSTCSADCTSGGGTTIISGGGGGGGGGLSAGDLKKIEDIVKSFLDVGGVKLDTTSVYKELFAGETTTFRIKLKNTLTSKSTVSLSTEGDIIQFISFESSVIELGPSEERDALIRITAPRIIDVGNYEGSLVLVSGDKTGKIPVTIRILEPEGKLLDVKIQPLTPTVAPGGILRLQTDLLNLGKTNRVDVQFDLQLLDVNTGEIITRSEEAFAVENTISTIKNLTIPGKTKPGKYMIKAIAYYSNKELEGTMQASSIAYVQVQYPLLSRNILGIRVWIYLLALAAIGALVGAYFYARWFEYRRKRFKIKVELNKLPQPGAESAFMGKIAETGIRAFMDMNKLQMHTLVAGATGGGKTIAAQDLVEEALNHKKSVIVFDPTAQWTGFLRKCEDSGMLKRYNYFDMKQSSAKSFNGSIKTIHDPYELINIKEYMNRPGEITIFNVSHLTPKEIDIVVASTIEQIFKSEPEESRELKTLVVYDEVHRLLPKFGGSGLGFIQLERGAREFRKWGIGLVLISQVLSDFIGEIKANIGTEIQMGTRYEGDLERVSMKYGEDILKSVVKEPIGTGMLVNAEYNSGKPYFVSFRPLLHSTRRLSNAELEKYEKYFSEIEDLDYQTAELKKLDVDVLDLELEIKLAKSKVKEGQFQMADMYLESLRPRVEEQWKKKGKTAAHLVRKKIAKEIVEKAVEEGKKEREKYIKKNPQKEISAEQELSNLKKLVEEKKRGGKKTDAVEMKISSLADRIKPFKGKIAEKDVEGIMSEIESIKKEVEKI